MVTTPKNYRGLVLAKVEGFTSKQVRVAYRNTWNYGGDGENEKFITPPNTLVKVVTLQNLEIDD